jgi:hypothetical protein
MDINVHIINIEPVAVAVEATATWVPPAMTVARGSYWLIGLPLSPHFRADQLQ